MIKNGFLLFKKKERKTQQMAPGFFKKIGNFFKNLWGGVKKVGSKILPVLKQVAPVVMSVIPGAGAFAPAVQAGLGIADKVLQEDIGGAVKDIGTNITKFKDRGRLFGGGPQNILRQTKLKGIKDAGGFSGIDSPRIKLKI